LYTIHRFLKNPKYGRCGLNQESSHYSDYHRNIQRKTLKNVHSRLVNELESLELQLLKISKCARADRSYNFQYISQHWLVKLKLSQKMHCHRDYNRIFQRYTWVLHVGRYLDRKHSRCSNWSMQALHRSMHCHIYLVRPKALKFLTF